MRLVSIYSALAGAGWLSLDVLFVIAWARLRAAERRSHHPVNATVIEFRPNEDVHRLATRRPQIRYVNS
jgi:hypothetical protein